MSCWGGQCCTFIPNNTAPDGTITRALHKLTTLADELAENSGVDTSVTGWLDSWFGKWKGIIVSIVTSFTVAAGVLVAIGCCIIPCVRGLVQRLIETALTKKMSLDPPPYQERLLCLTEQTDEVENRERECEEMLARWEASCGYKNQQTLQEEKGGNCEKGRKECCSCI